MHGGGRGGSGAESPKLGSGTESPKLGSGTESPKLGSGAESPKLGSGTDVLTIDARSLLRFSACGFDDAASAIDFNQRVVDLLFLGQYSFCGEERNPNVDAMLRTARAQGLPEEPLLLKRRNCTGQVGLLLEDL